MYRCICTFQMCVFVSACTSSIHTLHMHLDVLIDRYGVLASGNDAEHIAKEPCTCCSLAIAGARRSVFPSPYKPFMNVAANLATEDLAAGENVPAISCNVMMYTFGSTNCTVFCTVTAI